MSDITRDDLRAVDYVSEGGMALPNEAKFYRKVTDEEFDRLAREAGYVRVVAEPDNQRVIGRMLRALLTDECDCEDGLTLDVHPDAVGKCPKCGGRGWLPKDGVQVTESYVEGYLGGSGLMLDYEPDGPGKSFYVIPLDWLEAEDDAHP